MSTKMKQAPTATRVSEMAIAVLPVQNLSDNPDIDLFSTGLVMDLITDLSRFRAFQIISYDSISGLHPNESLDSPSLDQMKLDYVVKGLARYQHDKLILNVQLIHVKQNRLVWAEKFSGVLEELFQIQEEIVERIVVSLQQFVDLDVLQILRKKPVTSLNAYECWLRGLQELKKGTLEADEEARKYFRKAMEIDPHYPRAYTGMSLTYFNEWSCQIWNRWEVSQKGAFEWAQKAVELNEWDHISTTILGRLYLFNGDYTKAEHYLRKSIRLNPNDAKNLVQVAQGLVYLGYPEEAERLYEKARRLNPAGDWESFACGAFIRFESGRYQEAIDLVEKNRITGGWVDFAAYKAAAYYCIGDLERMREQWDLFLREFSEKINGGKPADTATALQWMMDVNPYRKDTHLKPFWEFIADGNAPEPTPAKNVLHSPNRFTREGEFWILAYEHKQVQLPELKGFYDILRLLAKPHKAIHCTELMEAGVVETGTEVIDDQAKQHYRERILDLQTQLQEAEEMQHTERLGELHREYDQLIDHLSKSVGKGGKTRKIADGVDKVRSAVTWRIRNAIKKIREAHPALGKHLEVSIKTGIFCEYSPEHTVNWEL